MRWTVAIVACGVGLSAPAGAQPATDDHEAEARGLFDAGRAALAEGRFEEALERFSRAHELSGRVELLYNVGLAADRAGHLARAVEAYRAFLAARPDSERRDAIDARVEVLRAQIQAREASALRPPERAASDPRPRPTIDAPAPESGTPAGPDLVAFGLLAGGAAALTIVASALYGHAVGEVDALHQGCAPRCDDSVVDPLRDQVLAAQVLYAVAGSVGVAALIALIVAVANGDDAPRASWSAGARF